VLVRHGVRDHSPGDALEHRVSRGVIAVMVRVKEDIDAPIVRPRLQPIEERSRLGGKLGVDDGDRTGVHEPTNGAATHGERADVPAQRREHGLSLRRIQHARERRPSEGNA
jgi:hypothetical protein